MKDRQGLVIYVGKAANLKKRLSSYFLRAAHPDLKTGVLVKKITDFETILTGSEKEALLLESTLIKRHKPRYNVILKDDKRYPSIRIDVKSDYPCLQIVRKPKKDHAVYFGPFSSPGAAHQTIKLINKTFRLRKCGPGPLKPRTRPCLNFQMGLCLAPCCHDVDKTEYQLIVSDVRMFLNGQVQELVKKLKHEMLAAAEAEAFETAARLRDKIWALEKTVERQMAVSTDFVDRDVIGVARADMLALAVVMHIRKGVLQSVRHYDFTDDMSSDHEIVDAFLKQYYPESTYIPPEILVPVEIPDAMIYNDWLSGIKGAGGHILPPRRGNKMRLIRMATENARSRLKKKTEETAARTDVLNSLQNQLKLDRLPLRIECFDNSGIMGSHLVAGMVVYTRGIPDRKSYRKYIVKNVDLQDDYAAMKEVLERRFKKQNSENPLPDLLMVDGGKGQLNVACRVLKTMGLAGAFDVIGIAKRDAAKNEPHDKIFKPGRMNPLNFGKQAGLLHFLQRIRDEAHRFAITFHRQKRAKTALDSSLDAIPGIGQKRKAALIKKFSSIRKIRAATVDDIASVPGMTRTAAENVHAFLNRLPEKDAAS
jgi:excinuclease ABC subunit C